MSYAACAIQRRFVPGMLAAAALALLAGAPASADPPSDRMTYQGQLREGGAPANGTYTIRFGFYNSATGGTEIASQTNAGIAVTDGLFTTTLGPTLIDGPSAGTYTTLANLFRDHSSAHVEITVNGVLLGTRQPVNSAPYAQNAFRAHSLDNVAIRDGSVWTVDGQAANLTIGGSSLRLQIGDSTADALVLQGSLYMLPDGTSDNTDQRINFLNGGVDNAEALLWDDFDDRFEFTDALAIAGPLSVGNNVDVAEVFSRFGSGFPLSTSMNGIGDVFVADDLEVRSSLIVSGNVLMRSGQADGDAVFNFREGGSDTAKSFRWDDSEDRFVFSDDIRLGESANFQLTTAAGGASSDGVAEIRSTGGVSIRIDTDFDESGASAGVFAITCDVLIPLLRLQGTDEANLELDNGVVTDAFDFAEAFRVAPGQTLEPGDVVVHAIGSGLNEHCEIANEAGERLLLGVVSTNPAFTAGMSFEEIERVDPALTAARDAARAAGNRDEVMRLEAQMEAAMKRHWKPIAQIGRVPTKVDGSRGPIKAGDYLTSSPTPGHAMKLTGPGMTIGVALEDFDGTGKGVISVFVRPMWHGGIGSEMEAGGVAGGGTAVVHTALGTPAAMDRLTTLEQENAALRQRLEQIETFLQPRLTSK